MCRSKTCIWDRRDPHTQMRFPLHFSSDVLQLDSDGKPPSLSWTDLKPAVVKASGKTPMNSSGFASTGERTEKGLVLDWCWLSSYGLFLILSFPSPAKPFAQAQISCLLVWGSLSYSDQKAAGLKCAVLAPQLWPGGGWQEQHTNLWTGEKNQTLVQKPTATKGAAHYRQTAQAPIAAFFGEYKASHKHSLMSSRSSLTHFSSNLHHHKSSKGRMADCLPQESSDSFV